MSPKKKKDNKSKSKVNSEPQPSTSTGSRHISTAQQQLDISDSTSSEQLVNTSSDDDSYGDPDDLSQRLLDFRSLQFNPFLALNLPSNSDSAAKVPDPSAPKYLNLHQYNKAVPNPSELPCKDLQLKPPVRPEQKKSKKDDPKEDSQSQQFPIPGRRFLAHQLPVFKPRVEAPNSLVIMETITGPLSALTRAMNEHRRVKIWTRNDTTMRGFVTGFIEAFDKHWNIALRDADEQFQRKRRIKYPVYPENTTTEITPASTNRKSYRSKSLNKARASKINTSKMLVSQSQSSYVPIVGSSENLMTLCRIGLSNLTLTDDGSSNLKNVPSGLLQPSNGEVPLTKSAKRKKELTIFKKPFKDPNGFTVKAQSKKYEIVERHVGQLFLMGNDIVFIETMTC